MIYDRKKNAFSPEASFRLYILCTQGHAPLLGRRGDARDRKGASTPASFSLSLSRWEMWADVRWQLIRLRCSVFRWREKRRLIDNQQCMSNA